MSKLLIRHPYLYSLPDLLRMVFGHQTRSTMYARCYERANYADGKVKANGRPIYSAPPSYQSEAGAPSRFPAPRYPPPPIPLQQQQPQQVYSNPQNPNAQPPSQQPYPGQNINYYNNAPPAPQMQPAQPYAPQQAQPVNFVVLQEKPGNANGGTSTGGAICWGIGAWSVATPELLTAC